MRIKKLIGVEIVGLTTCPCAQELMREKAVEKLTKMGMAEKDMDAFLNVIPMATHNQRGRGIIARRSNTTRKNKVLHYWKAKKRYSRGKSKARCSQKSC